MTHMKYPKIYRLGKDEVEGILENEVVVQEKIDGANVSIWMEDGVIKYGSRNHEVPDFRGLKQYVEKHEGIKELLLNNNYRLFGEWLVRHTVTYNEKSYNKFYLFDIYDMENSEWIEPISVVGLSVEYGIKVTDIFCKGKYTEDQLQEFVGKSVLGPIGEGIVIKSDTFVNKFGDRCNAKVVSDKFKEDNKISFGGNDKSSDAYWETYCMNKWITEARVEKIVKKLEDELDRKLELKDTPRVSSTVYHDFITEEYWEFNKKNMKIDFKALSRICNKKITNIFKELLDK